MVALIASRVPQWALGTISRPLLAALLAGMFGGRGKTVPHVSQYVDIVVRKLLRGADKQRWWSLSRDLQLLAEASPEEFLSAKAGRVASGHRCRKGLVAR